MLFHTPEFFLLMTLTLIIYYLFPKYRLPILGIANIIFYGAAGWGYLVLFMVVATLTYLASLHLTGTRKKIFLWLAILLNVGNLLFFKYSLFILNNLGRVIGFPLVGEDTFLLKVILPVGISFYTFQMLAYVVDVYQKKIEPCKSWLDFWVFIAFFAQLIAGPIMRGKDFLPQVYNLSKIRFQESNFKLGVAYLSLGLFKKIVLADYISRYADSFFNQGMALSGGEAWIAAYLFAFQIYFDFSAYSEMAVGVGHLFGVNLALNFQTPYLSTSATDFWRRWHITLSKWIRDYIYIPLGGSRRGELRQYVNLFLAMAISGLWHGAAWTFVAWGLFHGFLLIAHKLYTKVMPISIRENRLYTVFSIFVFFHITCIAWVFFRAEGMTIALNLIYKMVTFNPLTLEAGLLKYLAIIIVFYILHIIEYVVRKNYQELSSYWHRFFPAPIRGLAYTCLIITLVMFLQGEQSAFIYFQF